MATTITEECISCGACAPECPNGAITAGATIYVIDPVLCTECVGFFDQEACAAVCPVDCCVPDPALVETEQVLFERAKVIHPGREFPELFASRFNPGRVKKEDDGALGDKQFGWNKLLSSLVAMKTGRDVWFPQRIGWALKVAQEIRGEIVTEMGAEDFTPLELEEKDIKLRQRWELADSIERVARELTVVAPMRQGVPMTKAQRRASV